MPLNNYEIVIGLEIHIQAKTASKMFNADANAFGNNANTQASYITLAHPGTLPRVNKKAINLAIQLGLALGCRINQHCYFDRKNYFYPDLPKGFQTTQDNQPICIGGTVEIETEAGIKNIRLNRIHMEEDAGKSIHDLDDTHSMLDLNRAGTPLFELVTEPDLRSADEAVKTFAAIQKLTEYLGTSNAVMQQGNLRCDANISVRKKGATEYGTRCEIKNLNSFKFLRKAVNYEAQRQIKILESGGEIMQETRGFDTEKEITYTQRTKENAHDYRYFPEPDLAPIHITDRHLADLEAAMPELPKTKLQRFKSQYKLSDYDADLLSESMPLANYFEEVAQISQQPKKAANWILNSLKSYLNEAELTFSANIIAAQQLADIIKLVEDEKVNIGAAKSQLFPQLINNPTANALNIAKKLDILVGQSENLGTEMVKQIIAQNPKQVELYTKHGKKNLLGFFMGKVMKQAKGKLNPKQAEKIIKQLLNNES